MESTIEMFKHQIISSENADEVLADIENAVNEATALDNVLSSDRKDRLNS
jgi:ArsR family metal-binding transcriptional regulator